MASSASSASPRPTSAPRPAPHKPRPRGAVAASSASTAGAPGWPPCAALRDPRPTPSVQPSPRLVFGAQRRKGAKTQPFSPRWASAPLRDLQPRHAPPPRPLPRTTPPFHLCVFAPLRANHSAAPHHQRPTPRSAPPHPHPPTFFASPSCILSPHEPCSRCAAPRTRRPQAPVSLSTPKNTRAPRCTTTEGLERTPMYYHRAQSPGLCAGPPLHNRPPPLAEPPPWPPRSRPAA